MKGVKGEMGIAYQGEKGAPGPRGPPGPPGDGDREVERNETIIGLPGEKGEPGPKVLVMTSLVVIMPSVLQQVYRGCNCSVYFVATVCPSCMPNGCFQCLVVRNGKHADVAI